MFLMDLPALVTELHFRGFDQDKVDTALRCLVHVYTVQDFASPEKKGVLAEDIIDSYAIEVVQAASQLFLDTSMAQGREVFRVKWGCEGAAKTMQDELWAHAALRWEEFVAQLDERYLGFFLPASDEGARITSNWKLSKELRWFSAQVPRQGWKILAMMEDVTEVAWKTDLAFGFRPFNSDGVQAPKVLLHEQAYDMLKARKTSPPEELIQRIRLWKFFSEYDVNSTDFVALMRDCSLTLEEVSNQVKKFFEMNLTSQYREGQYPPYFINDKKKKEFRAAVRDLLGPMDSWLSRREMVLASPKASNDELATSAMPISEGPQIESLAIPIAGPA